MAETIQRKLNDSPAARWTALLLIASTMFFGYMFVDLMSPLQSMIEAQRGWTPDVFGMYGSSEFIFNVFGFLILAGIILVIMGFCQLGSLIKFIPFTITTGFTSGIAVTIVIGQLKDFFGVTYPAGMETIETMQKLKAFAAGFGTMNVHAVIVGLVCLAILIVMPMITEKIPGSLVAVIAGILAAVAIISILAQTPMPI